MITRFDIEERVRQWGLAEHVVEKDDISLSGEMISGWTRGRSTGFFRKSVR